MLDVWPAALAPRHLYRSAGLMLASDIALPGQVPAPADARPAIRIERGPVPRGLDGAIAGGPTWQYNERQILLDIPTIGQFLIEDGCSIRYAPDSCATPADVAAFVAGTILGILLHQRGTILIHASAIEIGGCAVLFTGPSGAGKSTLTAALGQRGYRQFADDQCAVSIDPAGRVWVASDGAAPRLWTQSIAALALDDRPKEAVRPNIEKYHLEAHPDSPASLPFGALYSLAEDRPPKIAGIAWPNIADAAKLLFAESYRPELTKALDQRALYFRASAAIAAAGRHVYTLTRPRRFEAIAAVIDSLEAHWASIGLTVAP
ncbi:HPr kinase/phosphorylase [Sphingomonas sp. 28-63-12]|uniref:HPr kinase/phosphorylase n=1 Tax=Sphingomonas sp. 28-63-12 TaxID=1970434 RepID=UPI000BD32C86|nr:MAG: hypothetical protein B7Y47_06035 [Sphingomonas sp. 28-63-12]